MKAIIWRAAWPFAAIVATLSAVTSGPLRAESSSTGAALPGLVSDPEGSVTALASAVHLNGDAIRVELTVQGSDAAPALLLTGALFGANGAEGARIDQHFPELAIRVDGSTAAVDDRFEASVGSRDITYVLQTAHIDPWTILRTPPLIEEPLDSAFTRNLLKNSGAAAPAHGGYLAQWSARRILRFALKPSLLQHVELLYSAHPARATLSAEQIATPDRERAYCVSAKGLRSALPAGWRSRTLGLSEYAIAAGVDGKPGEFVSLSFADEAVAPDGAPRHHAPNVVFWCGTHGVPTARAGNVRARAGVDDAGVVHVLVVGPVR